MPATASLDASLERDLGLDSLARVELLVRIERRLSLRVPEAALGRATTVRDVPRELSTAEPVSSTAFPAAVQPVHGAEPAPASIATLTDALRWHAERHPESVHVIYTDGESEIERLTYGALDTRVRAMAEALEARGLSAGERAALMLPTRLPAHGARTPGAATRALDLRRPRRRRWRPRALR